ncbi:MAG: hypothetical protein V3V12_07030 [Gammaproteobacteria bacterium]
MKYLLTVLLLSFGVTGASAAQFGFDQCGLDQFSVVAEADEEAKEGDEEEEEPDCE